MLQTSSVNVIDYWIICTVL